MRRKRPLPAADVDGLGRDPPRRGRRLRTHGRGIGRRVYGSPRLEEPGLVQLGSLWGFNTIKCNGHGHADGETFKVNISTGGGRVGIKGSSFSEMFSTNFNYQC